MQCTLTQYGGSYPASQYDNDDDLANYQDDIYEDSWTLSLPADALGAATPPAPRRVAGAEGGPWLQNYGGYRPVVTAAPAGLLAVRENWLNRLEYFRPAADPHPLHSVTAADARFAWDTAYAPQFALDGYGIPWLFFIDSARATVFYTRWLGTRWGSFGTAGKITRNSPRMEDGHLPIDRIAVEERLQAGQDGLGLLIENDSTTPAVAFRRITVPTLAADPGRKLLFLDLEELAAVDGIAQPLNSPRKQGQVLGPAPTGRPDSDYIGPPIRVLKQGANYRMWYAGRWKADNSDHWWEWYHALYAESSDGRTFQRANLGLVPFRGNTANNLMPGLVLSHAVTGVCYDPADPDPGRRYKFLRFPNSETFSAEARAGHADPWSDRINGQLLVSADGLTWSPLPASIDFPAGRPILGFIPQSLLSDPSAHDPQKRYKAYGFSAFNKVRRTSALATSGDAQHWTFSPDNPVLDPLIGDTPPVHGGLVEQIHDIAVWRDGDYYLALYQYQHDGGNLDLRLAAGRDGEHFTFIHPETPLIRAGRAGEWDSDQINPSAPLIDDRELKFYYGAVHFEGGTESTQVKTDGGLGLATLRLDGLTDLQPEAGRAAASLMTIPIAPGHATEIVVNADCGTGQLALELVDPATGQPVPGYSRSDCQPVRGDGTALAVRWRDHAGVGDRHHAYQLRVFLTGGAGFPKLYSIRFQ